MGPPFSRSPKVKKKRWAPAIRFYRLTVMFSLYIYIYVYVYVYVCIYMLYAKYMYIWIYVNMDKSQ